MIAEADIMEAIRDHCLVYSHRPVPRGHIRIDTRLLYPDGSGISVFVERGNLTRRSGLAISDFGKTLRMLTESNLNPWKSTGRMRTLADAVNPLDVHIMNDRLVLELESTDQIHEGIIKLSQACLRASLLIYIKRDSSQKASFPRTVRSIIEKTGLVYTRRYPLTGKFDKMLTFDYMVQDGPAESLVLTLDSKKITDSHGRSSKIFTKWHDIEGRTGNRKRVTIYNDGHQEAYRDEDLRRLQDVSTLIPVSNEEAIKSALRFAA